MVGLKTLALPLALGEHRVSRLELCGRNGVEKGLDDEGFNRGSVAMGTPGFGERAFHTHADGTRVGTVRHAHAVPTEAARRESLQEGGALARRPAPAAHLVGRALGIFTQARLRGQVLRPTDIGWINILEDALPLVHLAVDHRGGPLPR